MVGIENSGRQKTLADKAIKKELALLLDLAIPTPSNTGSLSSESRRRERLLMRNQSNSCTLSNQSTTRNTRWHIRQDNATLRRRIGYFWSYLSCRTLPRIVHGQGCAKQRQIKKQALLTTPSSCSRCESAAEHKTAGLHCKIDRQDKTPKKFRRISHDTKPQSSSSGNRAKLFLKGIEK